MFDAPPPPQGLQRVTGTAAVALSWRGGRTRLDRLHQAGSAKAMLPRVHAADPEIVFLNTAGGLTGGDVLDYRIALGAGARATAMTQTAERAYRSTGAMARMTVRAEVGAGGRLDWLPQETILFEGSALERETEISLAGDAVCLSVETLVLGRAAMGEEIGALVLRDRRRILRDGVPVLIEPVTLDPCALARRGGPAVLGGARAMATLVFAAPGAADAAGRLRALGAASGVAWAVSGWDGKCVLRAVAGDALPLRRLISRALCALRPGPLPRVWTM